MSRDEVDRACPGLANKDIDLSPEDFNHNCLAFALGDTSNWWDPLDKHGYWPPGFPKDVTLRTVESILRLHGFTVEIDPSETPTTDAIAVYGESGEWAHFAKFSDGQWSSKLGELHDVERIDLKDLECPEYGQCVKILSRPKRGRSKKNTR